MKVVYTRGKKAQFPAIARTDIFKGLRACPPEDQAYMPSHRFQWNLARLKDIPNNSKSQNGIAIAVFRVELHHPPTFFYINSLKYYTK